MIGLRSTLDRHFQAGRRRRLVHRYARERTNQIQTDLRTTDDGYTLICGDSHVELVSRLPLPARFVNAGIVGATASTCADLLDRLEMPWHAQQAILIIGTNDILPRRALSEKRVNAFRSSVDRIVDRLRAVSERVMVAALPPVLDRKISGRECLSVEVYTHELKASCVVRGCSYFDPFAFSRDERFGSAICGAFTDGVHLADYTRLAVNLCCQIGMAV